MSGKIPTGLTFVKLGLLFSLLSGCLSKAPTAPGTSAPLAYPVLLYSENHIIVWPHEERLTTTNIATGITFPSYTILDSKGARYSIRKVTDFDKNSGFFNMGTTSYRVFLHLKSEGTPGLDEAKAALKAVARRYDMVQNKNAADEAIDGAKSFRELVEKCGSPWDWR